VLIEGERVAVELPDGWDGRMRRRRFPEEAARRRRNAGRRGLVTLHAANFALPGEDGDYGTTATSRMTRAGVFATLIEFSPGDGLRPGRGLYRARGVPRRLRPEDFAAETMLRALPGQAGAQRFFTAGGRPFCLYAVLGSRRCATALAPRLNELLGAIRIG
jgi:hypothetical protein